MEPITVRETLRSDREALARIHAEVASYYLDLAPDYFQVLEPFAEQLDADAPAVDGATLHLGATSLRIEYLAVAATRRRQGVGTRFVEAAEAWGRAAGATISETTTYHGSPLSVPFWGERMS